jgi:gluconokinase
MIILVMGVSGSGKTTIGQLLAKSLNWEFCDADALHPAANIEKMRRGIPLDDADRKPWLQQLQQAIAQWLQEDKNIVLACSALKATYRQVLLQDKERMRLVYLHGDFKLIQERLRSRPCSLYVARTVAKSARYFRGAIRGNNNRCLTAARGSCARN